MMQHRLTTTTTMIRSVLRSFSTAVRTRYAPSPTGSLHLGGLRTALFNYLFAKSHPSGKFILRIEDTDKSRQVPGSIENLITSFKWLGLSPDEGPGCITNTSNSFGPYIQSERLPIYQSYAQQLLDSGYAYKCFCTKERLAALKKSQQRLGLVTKYDGACSHLSDTEIKSNSNYTIRLRTSKFVKPIVVKDLVKGYVSFDPPDDDQVLIKSDGYPTYHLASVVDDFEMKISHVIRGEEWLPSLPKHIMLYHALGFKDIPKFAHLGLLLSKDKKKLSKRSGDACLEDFQNTFLPETLLNFVALLGWNPSKGEVQEIFTMTDLISKFSIDNVNVGSSVVDADRMKWMNSCHIKRRIEARDEDLYEEVYSGLLQYYDNIITKEYLWKVIELNRFKVSFTKDLIPLCLPFVKKPCSSTTIITKEEKEIVKQVRDYFLQDENEFTIQSIKNVLKDVQKSRSLASAKSVMMPVRVAVTGMTVGASLADSMVLLGKTECIDRLTEYYCSCSNNSL